ncbi:hypothetical protein EGR_02274 [Echinococcus granulosus]|uniref:Uncharacterized protein n=1 Tax=Echinococcus granulosus TaxID=6210 RepID=W6UNM4_ECHGR|nr:hypothetical protein EGR_02274 [Echinococcus granulosus]EUB62833.1 hypothetical protein EGR_02274 [Echinococcus granulosus]
MFSSLFKKRLRTALALHIALWILVAIKILPEILFRFGLVSRTFMRKHPLPLNELWEYAWCFGSTIPVLFGYLSVTKNKVYLIRFSLVGTIAFGFVPIIMGCFLRAYELMDYYYTKNSRHDFFNFPFTVSGPRKFPSMLVMVTSEKSLPFQWYDRILNYLLVSDTTSANLASLLPFTGGVLQVIPEVTISL